MYSMLIERLTRSGQPGKHKSGSSRMENKKERTAGMRKEAVGGQPGLYRPEFEHDNCGIGAVVNIKGVKSHETVALSLIHI